MKNVKIYGGIYTKEPSKKTDQFIMDSIMTVLENKLVPYYLWETIAHNLMITKQGIVPKKIAKKILKGLLKLVKKAKIQQLVNPLIGDVHENIESQLTKTLGDDAGWFHLGRSRNDQSVVDQKLFTKKFLLNFFEKLSQLELILLKKAEQNKEVIMPGFTHLRSAMPSTFGFWWQAYLDQIIDLHQILKTVYQITDKSPLGAGASYGVNWKIDPVFTAKKLGFSKPLNNALSAINSRGIEDALIISNLTVFLTILSRMMEDLIIWSMPELNFIAISEEFTTGSSIMPQKMNPDIAEKVKSKSAKLIGNLNHVLVAMKGTPSGYNRDSAESKIAIINSLEESLSTVSITCDMLDKIIPNPETMKKATISSLPTKLADKLVEEYQIPFRLSHKIIGKIVGLVKEDLTKINSIIVETAIKEIVNKSFVVNQKLINDTLKVENALNQYDYQGSPKPYFVFQVNNLLEKEANQLSQWGKKEKKKFYQAEKNLYQEVKNFIENN
ncbi:MAG: Argininosuccinate lyase [Candidatus Roizmanbacteria bacterium GW2011_GWA2_34_18]|uniref:Argininosuccinate lyase n=1 Tax=Candidatus Roizmanbacteria bacterium GW2011_GWA2_34_18 TaxID=1618477 RepID=A0A0G0B9L0_9BACT|nr:MAG: Argininosuccinate lyase [Candidatus Roizmanbacteria bacterium GW2011_GWA2_34_18]